MKRLELTDKKFNFLTGIRFVKINKTGQSVWLFKCDCGNMHEAVAGCVSGGYIKSCGCLQSGIAAEHCKQLAGGPLKLGYGVSAFNSLYRQYVNNAKNSNRGKFDLTRDQFRSITSSNCYYCNQFPASEFYKPRNNGSYVYNGIDRKDNTKGYTIDNCVPCCKICNYMKQALTQEEFLAHIEKIHNYQYGK